MSKTVLKMTISQPHKLHWPRPHLGSAPEGMDISHCGKLLDKDRFATKVEDITCKVCRKPFFFD